MENNQLLPFERNRYYVGKLLTSADFQTEQTYFNNKRRFINGLMFGSGILCGLGIYNLDDLSIMIESGVAVDDMGREIVLENSVVKKLSAIEGFETLESNNIVLCIKYAEEAVHPVYSVNRQEQSEEYELNRIREAWQLFLIDAESIPEKEEAESEFLNSGRLFSDDDFNVSLSMPASISCGDMAKMLLTIEKLTDEDKEFSMDCVLQTPAFVNAEGNHELNLKFEDAALEKGQKAVKEYWLTAQQQEAKDTVLIAKAGLAKIISGGIEKRLADNFILKLSVVDMNSDYLIAREIGKISLESRSLGGSLGFIPLAQFVLQRTNNAYFIESIDESNVKSYIYTCAVEQMRKNYSQFYRKPFTGFDRFINNGNVMNEDEPFLNYREPMYASGICEISLDPESHKGDVLFSDEIMHGLGKGNVFVQVGFEYLADDPRLRRTAKSTVYGDPELFEGENLPISYAQTAVRVMNDRGSFIVAAKLTRDTNYVLISLKWVAIKLPAYDDNAMLNRIAGKSIDAAQPTVVLATRESHFFTVRFKNMEPCSLAYELTERDSGTITADGIYTAPAREGVYEICISCVDLPLISTYAYAIVKKRDADVEGTQT